MMSVIETQIWEEIPEKKKDMYGMSAKESLLRYLTSLRHI